VLGENGLLKQLTKAVLERAMQAELTHHLGDDKHSPICVSPVFVLISNMPLASTPIEASKWPSGDQSILLPPLICPWIDFINKPVSALKKRLCRLSEQDAKLRPSGAQAIPRTKPPCPRIVRRRLNPWGIPFLVSFIDICLSPLYYVSKTEVRKG
jgi:hypothetical protein